MTTAGANPAVVIALLLFAVSALAWSIQGQSGQIKPWLVLLCGASVGIATLQARARCFTMLRRLRWLLLAMMVVTGFTVPGRAIPNAFGLTWEGLVLAVTQGAYLLTLASWLALLARAYPVPQLLSGLLCVLEVLGSRREFAARLALRLSLVLDAVGRSRDAMQSGSLQERLAHPERLIPPSADLPHGAAAAISASHAWSVRLLILAALALPWLP